jgi:hypothetical protein
MRTTHGGGGSFFSGGADGSYTLLRHRDEITHLISVQGIDVQVDNDAHWARVIQANRELASAFNKTLVPVRTNIRRWCIPRGVPWYVQNGSGLASIAHALGFSRCYIAASHTYAELFPWGSHPLTDALWSSDSVAIAHDGSARRSDKIRAISENEASLRLLRVCWHEKGYNCGHCEKCIRTRTTLRLLGLSTPSLPPLEDASEISRLKAWDESEESFFADNLELAKSVGDKPVTKAVRKLLRDYKTRQALAELDRQWTGGMIHRLKSKVARRR